MTTPALRIAVLVPCYNEEAAVATVVADFRKAQRWRRHCRLTESRLSMERLHRNLALAG